MSAKKFKVGDRVRILSYPGIWSSGAGGSCPAKANYPLEGVIEEVIMKDHTAINVFGYGFDADVLSSRGLIEMLEPIPAARWHVGQEVWDDVLHPGETGRITRIEPGGSIIVDFNNVPCYYAFDSIYFRFLSAVPYTFELPPQPEPIWIPEKWERVLVRNDDSQPWFPAMFTLYEEKSQSPYRIWNGFGFKYCIKWDANKVGKV